MSNKKHSSGLNFLFPKKDRLTDPVSDNPVSDDLIDYPKIIDITKTDALRAITTPFEDYEPPSASLKTLKNSFNNLHPFAQSCISRLVDSAHDSYEFNTTYQSMLEAPYSSLTKYRSDSSNILMLIGLSTLLNWKIIKLPFVGIDKRPSLSKTIYSKQFSDWQIVDCTDESLDTQFPNVKVIKKDDDMSDKTIYSVPLDVVFFFNKPY